MCCTMHIYSTSVAQKRQQHMSKPTQVPRRAIAIVGGGAQKQDTPPFSALKGDFTRLAGEEVCSLKYQCSENTFSISLLVSH